MTVEAYCILPLVTLYDDLHLLTSVLELSLDSRPQGPPRAYLTLSASGFFDL